jgi:hypothetical protein
MPATLDLEELWTLDSHERCHVKLLRPPQDRCPNPAAWTAGVVCVDGCWSHVHTYSICDEHHRGIVDAASPSPVTCSACHGRLRTTWAERLT